MCFDHVESDWSRPAFLQSAMCKSHADRSMAYRGNVHLVVTSVRTTVQVVPCLLPQVDTLIFSMANQIPFDICQVWKGTGMTNPCQSADLLSSEVPVALPVAKTSVCLRVFREHEKPMECMPWMNSWICRGSKTRTTRSWKTNAFESIAGWKAFESVSSLLLLRKRVPVCPKGLHGLWAFYHLTWTFIAALQKLPAYQSSFDESETTRRQ